MTDRTFTAAELRELLDGEGSADDKVQELYEMILFPPLPTLADMTPEERAACAWMQADLADGGRMILDQNGRSDGVPADRVTPRPDLPRLEWPSDQ